LAPKNACSGATGFSSASLSDCPVGSCGDMAGILVLCACVNCCLIELAFQNNWHLPKLNVLLHNCSIQFAASTAATADRKPFNTARAVILLISNDST